MKLFKSIAIILILIFLFYNPLVEKSQLMYKATLHEQFEKGLITQQEYDHRLKEDNYWKHFFNVSQTEHAWD